LCGGLLAKFAFRRVKMLVNAQSIHSAFSLRHIKFNSKTHPRTDGKQALKKRNEHQMYEQTVNVERIEELIGLFGSFDSNIRLLEQSLHVTVLSRENEIKIQGEPEDVYKAARVVDGLLSILARGEAITDQNVNYVISLVEEGEEQKLGELAQDVVCVTMKGKPVKPKTLGQKKYVEAIGKNTVTMGIGPAGTGKTYLAVAAAVTAFRQKRVSRIILTRPAVEAGEKLGFLPGDLQNKVDPYLRPLYDAMFDMLGGENYTKYVERGNIEVAPLAYMRGRTLDDSFIILDEAQNTTREQMKMFLTRLGFNSKVVITGDVTQIDLPGEKVSGLKEAAKVLKNIDDIAICELTARDVVRHALVQRIIRAYEESEAKTETRRARSQTPRRTVKK
jgi:phosphate starvation-inducible PhoH-like protein